MCFYIRCPHKRFFLDLVLLDGPGLPGPGFFQVPVRSHSFYFRRSRTFRDLKIKFFSTLKAPREALFWHFCPSLSSRFRANLIVKMLSKPFILFAVLIFRRAIKTRGMTLVSSPHRTSGWTSRIARINVVPDRGIPPTQIIGCLSSTSGHSIFLYSRLVQLPFYRWIKPNYRLFIL